MPNKEEILNGLQTIVNNYLTLSIIIGLLLIYNGLASPSITLTLIVFGLFYGIFGVLKLGVILDIFLVFGTLALLTKYIISVKA